MREPLRGREIGREPVRHALSKLEVRGPAEGSLGIVSKLLPTSSPGLVAGLARIVCQRPWGPWHAVSRAFRACRRWRAGKRGRRGSGLSLAGAGVRAVPRYPSALASTPRGARPALFLESRVAGYSCCVSTGSGVALGVERARQTPAADVGLQARSSMAEDKRPGAGMESQGGQGILSSFANKLRAYTGPLTTPKAAAIHIPASGHELPGKHTPGEFRWPS